MMRKAAMGLVAMLVAVARTAMMGKVVRKPALMILKAKMTIACVTCK
jgi:hypothetical protein